MAPLKGVLGLKPKTHRKSIQNLLLQNFLAEILEIWSVASSSGPLPNLLKMVLSQGFLGLQVIYTYISSSAGSVA